MDPRLDGRGYQLEDPAAFELQRFAAPDNLWIAIRQLFAGGGHGAGIDGFGPEDFSDHELRPILRDVSRALLTRTYRAYPTREVLIPRSPTRVRTLELQRFTDRMVAKALLNCLDAIWRRRVRRRDRIQIFAELDWAIRRRSQYILATDDIRDCFPSAPLNEVLRYHRQELHHEDLLDLVERILWGHRAPTDQIGLCQGSPYSPVAMDVLLHHMLDLLLEERSRSTPQFRYVDNLAYLCRDVREATNVLSIARELVGRAGFELKQADGEPQDLRDPSHSRVVLGMIPHWRAGGLSLSIPQTAFDKLAERLQAADQTTRPADNALLVCRGWLWAFGPALTKAATPEVVNRVVELARLRGFRNVTWMGLSMEARKAHQKWLKIRENAR